MKAGKFGIRNGTGDKLTGRDDKPSKDVGPQKADTPPKKKRMMKKKAKAFGKVKL